MYKATGFAHCYTLESNYNTGKHTNPVPAASGPGSARAPPAQMSKASAPAYTPDIWYGVGRACLFALLDLEEDNPWSRLPKSSLKSIPGARKAICTRLGREKSYRAQAMVLKTRRASAKKGKDGGGRKETSEVHSVPTRRRYRPPPRKASGNIEKGHSTTSALNAAAAALSSRRQQAETRFCSETGSAQSTGWMIDDSGGRKGEAPGSRRSKETQSAQPRVRGRPRATEARRVPVNIPSAMIEKPKIALPPPRRQEKSQGRQTGIPRPRIFMKSSPAKEQAEIAGAFAMPSRQ